MNKKLLFRFVALVAAMMCALGASAAEAYACYTPSNKRLTFYYDNYRSSRTGITLDLNTGNNYPAWYDDTINVKATQVVFNPSFANARPSTTYCWFYDMTHLQTIGGMEYLNTSEVTNMRGMFSGCSSLLSLDVSHFNTSQVTTMYAMFANCTNLTNLDLNSFNTAEVTDMSYMFYGCNNMISLDLSSFNTAKVTDMSAMFYNCYYLMNLDLSSFNTAQVDNMLCMFYCCYDLPSLDLSHFNTAKVTNMRGMFWGCTSLTSLDVTHFNTSQVTTMWGMFGHCYGLTSLDLSSFNTAQVTDMHAMFYNCPFLSTIFVGIGWNTTAVTESDYMFTDCTRLVGGKGTTYNANHIDAKYAHIDGGNANPGYFTPSATALAYACFTESNSTLTFYYDNNWPYRTSMVYGMNTGADTPDWINDSIYFITNHVVFDPSFAGARPTSTHGWFSDCVQSIEGMEYLNTSEVTDMSNMFVFVGLESIDVSHFNTDKVTNMKGMFAFMPLTSLDLSNWNTENVTDMYGMFYGCQDLTTIKVGNGWSTAAVTSSEDMFSFCSNLVGGMGTVYDPAHIDAEYAHIDGGPSNPGYFTANSLLGDVDGDGQVKIGDVTALINYLLSGDATGINLQAADCDQDGNFKIGDVTTLINYLLSGSW